MSVNQDCGKFIRLMNWMENALDKVDPDDLIEAACQKTGLSDLGDKNFREPLKILLKSYKEDARLTTFGWMFVHHQLIHILSNRLLIRDELKRHPEILDEQIPQPLFIISLPRTGTTLLQRLLSQDPFNRSLLFYETYTARRPQADGTDPRITAAENFLKIQHEMMRSYIKIHPMYPKAAEEPTQLERNNLKSFTFYIRNYVPQYYEWFNKQNMTETFSFFRQQLQILQFGVPISRWVLKSPGFMLNIKEIFTVFPDACMVQTHRDPCKFLPSVCNLQATVRKATSDDVDPFSVAQECFRDMQNLLGSGLAARETLDRGQVYDIHYQELVENPIGAVRRIYNHFGYEFDKGFEKRMREWLGRNPKGKEGKHHYSLEQFDLDKAVVKRSFSEYCERFDIPDEE